MTGASGRSRLRSVPRSLPSCASSLPELLHTADTTTSDANAWKPIATFVGDGLAGALRHCPPPTDAASVQEPASLKAQLLERGTQWGRRRPRNNSSRSSGYFCQFAVNRRNSPQSRNGSCSYRALRADRYRHRPWQGVERQFSSQRTHVSQPDADRNACDGHARRGSSGHCHHRHTPEFVRFWSGIPGGHSMITEKAMLAAVHISIWTAVKHDRKISRDVASQHGAHQGAGRYNKQLLRGADKLDELRTLAGQIRQYFYKITLPWSDEGIPSLLPVYELLFRSDGANARVRGRISIRASTASFRSIRSTSSK